MYKFYVKDKNGNWIETKPTNHLKNDLVQILYEDNSVEVYYPAANTTWKVEKVELTLEEVKEKLIEAAKTDSVTGFVDTITELMDEWGWK